MAKLTKKQANDAKAYLLSLYRWANALGDAVDPKRKHEHTLAREFTALAATAARIINYLEADVRQ